MNCLQQQTLEPRVSRSKACGLALAFGLAGLVFASAAPLARAQSTVPLEPNHDTGQSVTGAFEGWFQNADGTYSILFGYYNRNL